MSLETFVIGQFVALVASSLLFGRVGTIGALIGAVAVYFIYF